MKAEVRRIKASGKSLSVFDLESQVGAEVVPQALSHAGELVNQGYSKFL